MRKRAQSSVEFLAVTGIGILIIVGVAGVYLSYTKSNQDKVALQQVTNIGESVMQQVSTVYSLGKNSWVTLNVDMPDSVLAVYTVENNALVFDVGTIYGTVSQPVFSSITIIGVNTSGQKSFINTGNVTIHSGKTALRITSQGNNVTIQAIA